MNVIELLAVVEVSQDKRIFCQAVGCGHSVYKRIHLVRENGNLSVLGSECFKKLFGDSNYQAPFYSTSDGRRLSEEERQMLLQNTATLVERLKQEFEMAVAARIKLRDVLVPASKLSLATRPRRQIGPTPEAIRRFEAQAKRDVGAKYDVEANLAGWRGLVLDRISELSREE